jgi:resuscitation-promoting factor RpfB
VRHPVRALLYTVVVLGLLGGALGWVSLDKVVTLRIDGQPRAVHTYASTVQGVLDDEKVDVKAHDVLAPGPDAKVKDGSEIVLRRGRLLRLTVDGQSRPVWVQATTVQEALEQIGFRQKGLALSASRSDRLPLDGFDLAIRTPKTVTVLADGRRLQLTTTVVTVGEALEKLGVKIDSDDRVSQLAAAPLVNGMTITVTRVMRKTLTTKTVLKYRVIEKSDPTLNKGTRKVTTQGVDGLQEVTYVATYINGKVASKKVVSTRVVRKAVDQVVLVGTKAVQPAECADFPTTGGLDWCGLAKCESGLNPTAVNPAGPYYGLYQFDLGTWQSNGGSGLPTEASVAEQTRVAYNLYRARGRSPWPVCGQYL